MGWYSDAEIASLRARILELLRDSGPIARIDLPELVGATDYLVQKTLKPLLKDGTIRITTQRRTWDRRWVAKFPTHTTATCYELTGRAT